MEGLRGFYPGIGIATVSLVIGISKENKIGSAPALAMFYTFYEFAKMGFRDLRV